MNFLSIEFLRIAFIGALLSAGATSLISVFVSLKKISYMSEAFSHISFAGIALALLLGLNMNLITFLFVITIAVIIALISKKFQLEESNITTIFLSVSMSIGIILISLNKNLNIDITGYLFGNILFITKYDIVLLVILLIINFLFIILFFKELFYIAYNEKIAAIYRIPARKIYFLFIIILAMNIVVSVKILGIILITAQLILPGITALNFIKNVKKAIIIAFFISEISSFAGFYFSYLLDLPTGATIVLILFMFFIISLFINNIIQIRKGAVSH